MEQKSTNTSSTFIFATFFTWGPFIKGFFPPYPTGIPQKPLPYKSFGLHRQVMYVKGSGVEEKFVVLADDEYNEMEIPLSRFVGYTTVEEGATVVLYKDDEEIVKIVVQK